MSLPEHLADIVRHIFSVAMGTRAVKRVREISTAGSRQGGYGSINPRVTRIDANRDAAMIDRYLNVNVPKERPRAAWRTIWTRMRPARPWRWIFSIRSMPSNRTRIDREADDGFGSCLAFDALMIFSVIGK
ncbi:hypothetical protein [Nevskia soli]|uniref:hypothetical protein n=1 Tax=Nevskia soli TaxID=418856 RepID=UPI0012FCE0CF|nr:hypothetical protein [Nevskia soli]